VTDTNPDLDWYTGLSRVDGASPRCPYANVHKCPRYYESLRGLGDSGMITSMSPETIQELDTLWKGSPFVPTIAEHETSISSSGECVWGFKNFCPEVSFDFFGLFADRLYRYADEIGAKSGEAYPPHHWRRRWASVSPLHYLKCPLYSQLLTSLSSPTIAEASVQNQEEILEIKPEFWGIRLNVKALFCWITKWFHVWRTK